MIIREIKRHLNKPDEMYECELMGREEGYVGIRYVSEGSGRIGEITIEAGSVTLAHYWEDRGYVLWDIRGPDGALIGYCFHICKDVEMGEDFVCYLDLLLDLWFGPDGEMTVLDEDEVQTCYEQGRIGDDEVAWIEKQKELVRQDFEGIVLEVRKR